MYFRIRHHTLYRYSRPVFLEPHRLALTPRTDGYQHVVNEAVRIVPAPTGQTLNLSEEGNTIRRIWFEGLHDQLAISVALEVETLRENPFDYLPDPCGERLPFRLPPDMGRQLAACFSSCSHTRLQRMADRIAESSDYRTLHFLDQLNRELNERIDVIVREKGEPRTALETLERGKGACRDLVVLFLEVSRAAGVPSRFVSGYQAGDLKQKNRRHLHAWAEVFVPGGGWRGYDPTLGLAVADQHISLVASSDPGHTLPIEGTFRGNASYTMETDLQVCEVRSL